MTTIKQTTFTQSQWQQLLDLLGCSSALANQIVKNPDLPLSIGLTTPQSVSARWLSLVGQVCRHLGVDQQDLMHSQHRACRTVKRRPKPLRECWRDLAQRVEQTHFDYQSTALPPAGANLKNFAYRLYYRNKWFYFTKRQHQVLLQFACQRTNTSAGQALGISHRTVTTHSENICETLGCRGKRELVDILSKSDFRQRYAKSIAMTAESTH